MSACLLLPALTPPPSFEVGFLGVRRSRGERECEEEEGRALRLCQNPSYANGSLLF